MRFCDRTYTPGVSRSSAIAGSCRLYTDCHWARNQVSSQLIPEYRTDSSFDSAYLSNDASSDGLLSLILNTYLTSLRCLFHSRSLPRLFHRSSTGWFEANSCKPTSGGLLPSSVQQHKLSLAFVTHVRQAPRRGTQLKNCDGAPPFQPRD